jgi:acyl carrier protein
MSGPADADRVAAVVKDFLKERFDISAEAVTDDVTLRDLGLDSILMLDVMLEVEDRLDVKLKDLSLPPNPRFKDVVALILRNTAGE